MNELGRTELSINRTHPDVTDIDFSGLVIGCWNVGGLFKNHPQIFSNCNRADIVCLLETFLEAETAPHVRVPDNMHALFFHGKRKPGARRASGGFALLIKNHVAKPADCKFEEASPGICVAEIKLLTGRTIICVFVYRAADKKSAVYDDNFHEVLMAVLSRYAGDNVLLCGDFNTKMGDMSGPLGLLDFAADLLPLNAESTEVEGPAEELFEILTSCQMYGIFDNRDQIVRDTFRCRARDGVSSGGSLIDFVYANCVLYPAVSHVNSIFCHPCNHALNLVYLDVNVPDHTPREIRDAIRRTRVVDLQKLMELEHTDELKDLARSTDGFDPQSAAAVISDFVNKFTTVIVSRARDQKQYESLETLDAKRTARRIERRLKTERDSNRREQLRVDWLIEVEKWRKGRDQDIKATVAETQASYYDAIRNKNLYKAWRIARRDTAGKGGGIKDKVTSFIPPEQWENHFSRLFNGSNVPLRAPTSGKTVHCLDRPFTGEEVEHALETKKTHRALGPDGFSIDHLRILRYDELTCAALANFMNLCVKMADVPDEWGHAFLFILYKGTGPKDDANSFRGITLKSQLLKLFESMLCARLRAWAEAERILPSEQIAYRPGCHGADHLYSLTLLREFARSTNHKLHAAFVDLRKAFPSVGRQRLLDELSRIGVSDAFLRILTRLYSSDTFSILLDGEPCNRAFLVSSGVHEGSPLSPLLFIIFIAGLTKHLCEKHDGDGAIILVDGTRLYCLLYADDVLLISFSRSGLQKSVDETCRFFDTMGLTVNPGKSDVVVFLGERHGVRHANIGNFEIAGLSKQDIVEAKYLGVIFQNDGTWREQLSATLARCRMARGRCQVICSTLGFAKPGPMIQTYDTFVSSVYRYSLGVWGILAGDLTRIDNLFCDFIRRQYRIPASTCRRSILMQFARRCAACDAKYLAAVQLARGLCNPGSVWAQILATTWSNGQNWLASVRSHLQLLNLERIVLETFK